MCIDINTKPTLMCLVLSSRASVRLLKTLTFPQPHTVVSEIYLSWAQTNFRFREALLYSPALGYFLLAQMLCIQRTNTTMKNPSHVVDRVFKGIGISFWFPFELNLMQNELCNSEHKPHALPWICEIKHKCRGAHDKSTPSFWQWLCTKVPVTMFKMTPLKTPI